jgi:hypothetical protein
MTENEFLAERCRDAWAVLRCVPANEGEQALALHGREYDEDNHTGTRDGLADDMLEVAAYLTGLAK